MTGSKMIRSLLTGIRLEILLAAVLFFSSEASAVYDYSSDSVDISVSGFIGSGGGVAKYPGNGFFEETSRDDWFVDFRLLAEGNMGENLSAWLNILQNVRSIPVFQFTGPGPIQHDVERSGLVYNYQHDSPNSQAAIVLDAAHVRYGDRQNELTIGRQPVTTTVTYFFTPNDFFAPFSPNTFFRVYKPGVDALRYEHKLKALSQLSLIGVLGYEIDPSSDSGWKDEPDWQRTSILGRVTHTAGEFEWGMLGGLVRKSVIAGFSLQGEVFDWLGVRAEGHYGDSWSEGDENGLITAVSLEHRFSSSLIMRLEYMFNGYGNDSLSEGLANRMPGFSRREYLGRHYTAFDLSYEITPLLFGEMLYLQNWSDSSFSVSFNAVYSVSDESELAVTAILPGGDEPEPGGIQSELGTLPVQVNLEYRIYF